MSSMSNEHNPEFSNWEWRCMEVTVRGGANRFYLVLTTEKNS